MVHDDLGYDLCFVILYLAWHNHVVDMNRQLAAKQATPTLLYDPDASMAPSAGGTSASQDIGNDPDPTSCQCGLSSLSDF